MTQPSNANQPSGAIGYWKKTDVLPAFSPADLLGAVPVVRTTAHVIRDEATRRLGLALGGEVTSRNGSADGYPVLAALPPLYPEWLGDRAFLEAHGLRFPYVAGAMARGITSARMVIEMGRAGMLGFFGAAGLAINDIEQGLDEIQRALEPGAHATNAAGAAGAHATSAGVSSAGAHATSTAGVQATPAWGSNLIHSPHEAALEEALVDLYLRRGVRRVSASAFMAVTPSVVRYAARGLRLAPDGRIVRVNHVFAKVSRPEVAREFMSPPPAELLSDLVARGSITPEEAALTARLPVAEDITAEADSGGHTDNRPLVALLPTFLSLRDRLTARHGFFRSIRVGAAGGIGTPSAAAAAFALGASYVLTGSVNQSAVESALSPVGKEMLAKAGIADVTMAPAADMFELGARVQVLKLGSLFGARATRLYELYVAHDSPESLPPAVKAQLEKDIFRMSLDEVWRMTEDYFRRADPSELEQAARDSRHRLALIFRWYLGQSSRWAISGESARRIDFQIWCGPAMGAFNDWVQGSFLEPPENRSVVQIALNLLEGAAVVTRAQQLRACGVPVPPAAFDFRPRPLR